MATCPRSLNFCLQICSCPAPRPHAFSRPGTPMWCGPWLLRAGAQPAPGKQATTPALTPPSLHQTWAACTLRQSSFQLCSPRPHSWLSAASYGRHAAGGLGHLPHPAIPMRDPGKPLRDHKDREFCFCFTLTVLVHNAWGKPYHICIAQR